jgi:hypothetical protein
MNSQKITKVTKRRTYLQLSPLCILGDLCVRFYSCLFVVPIRVHSRLFFAFLVLFLDLRSLGEVGRGYFGSLFCDLLLRLLCLFAAIPLCAFVPLCEILFASIRVHSRLFFASFVPFCGYLGFHQSPFTFHLSPHPFRVFPCFFMPRD